MSLKRFVFNQIAILYSPELGLLITIAISNAEVKFWNLLEKWNDLEFLLESLGKMGFTTTLATSAWFAVDGDVDGVVKVSLGIN